MASSHYCNNQDFLLSIINYKEEVTQAKILGATKPMVPEYCAECLLRIATRLATKPNFASYTYKEDMISDGIENCLLYFDNFDPDRSSIVTIGQNLGKSLVGKRLVAMHDGFDGRVMSVKPSIAAVGAETVNVKYLSPMHREKRRFYAMETLMCVEDSTTVVANLVKTANPFSYFTQTIGNAFLRRIDKERKQMVVKGKILQEMPYNAYDLQAHDEYGIGAAETYMETMRNSGAFNDVVVKDEDRRSKKKRKNTHRLDPSLIEEIVMEIENEL